MFTNMCTQKGYQVMIGDILKGNNAHAVVVCQDQEGNYVCIPIETQETETIWGKEIKYKLKEFRYPLEEMIRSWSDLEWIGTILRV